MTIYINLLFISISLYGLWFLFFIALPDYLEYAYRQKLFVLRDKLFDEAEAGRIKFDDPVYIELRGAINSSIRFAHRLNLYYLRAIAQELRGNSQLKEFIDKNEKESALRTNNPEKQILIKEYMSILSYTRLRYMFVRSPLLSAYILGKHVGKKLIRSFFDALLNFSKTWSGAIKSLGSTVDNISSIVPILDRMEKICQEREQENKKQHLIA